MTPAARVQAASEVLDRIADAVPAEKALTNWARGARYAGSGDRAAVRDLVFDVIRTRRSAAAIGGGTTGRALMLGHLRQSQTDPETLFDGSRHGPAPLSEAERAAGRAPTEAEALDLPDWLVAVFRDGLGPQAEKTAQALRQRAPVFLRVNTLKSDLEQALAALAEDDIGAALHPASPTALVVDRNPRRIQSGRAYREGLVELQDAASQAVVDLLPLTPGDKVLDYCAGGGGKALAMAARLGGPVMAHDADPRRMRDLPARADRAGAQVAMTERPAGQFDLVLCDVPCSGSGAWRRAAQAKWTLTPEQLGELTQIQGTILHDASALVGPSGHLVYVTCSVLPAENTDQIADFTHKHPEWRVVLQKQFLPGADGDGFFLCVMTHG